MLGTQGVIASRRYVGNGRRTSSRPIPSATIPAPDTSRNRRTKLGRPAMPVRTPPAANAISTSAAVLSATEMRPRAANCRVTLPADGFTNCGTKARKNAAVLGFRASTRTPSRKARRAPTGGAAACPAAAARASLRAVTMVRIPLAKSPGLPE